MCPAPCNSNSVMRDHCTEQCPNRQAASMQGWQILNPHTPLPSPLATAPEVPPKVTGRQAEHTTWIAFFLSPGLARCGRALTPWNAQLVASKRCSRTVSQCDPKIGRKWCVAGMAVQQGCVGWLGSLCCSTQHTALAVGFCTTPTGSTQHNTLVVWQLVWQLALDFLSAAALAAPPPSQTPTQSAGFKNLSACNSHTTGHCIMELVRYHRHAAPGRKALMTEDKSPGSAYP